MTSPTLLPTTLPSRQHQAASQAPHHSPPRPLRGSRAVEIPSPSVFARRFPHSRVNDSHAANTLAPARLRAHTHTHPHTRTHGHAHRPIPHTHAHTLSRTLQTEHRTLTTRPAAQSLRSCASAPCSSLRARAPRSGCLSRRTQTRRRWPRGASLLAGARGGGRTGSRAWESARGAGDGGSHGGRRAKREGTSRPRDRLSTHRVVLFSAGAAAREPVEEAHGGRIAVREAGVVELRETSKLQGERWL
jgi:hypothetical protein